MIWSYDVVKDPLILCLVFYLGFLLVKCIWSKSGSLTTKVMHTCTKTILNSSSFS